MYLHLEQQVRLDRQVVSLELRMLRAVILRMRNLNATLAAVESDNDDASVRGQTSTPTPENPEEGGEDENDLDVTITAVDEEADELVARRERRRAWRI
ncbi:hypothetical protein PC119_g22065 [Phytophthora cactorum]|nr:hypothetical protein PC119_g22065 [Phytophthora cactorum]KAG3132564.1 hypothetical protein C6341_g22856 [Phytophthora cactorum]